MYVGKLSVGEYGIVFIIRRKDKVSQDERKLYKLKYSVPTHFESRRKNKEEDEKKEEEKNVTRKKT